MEGKSKLTKEVVAQEARFILDSLISAGQFSKEVQFEELRRLCEQSVSLRLLDYLNFLERFGYLTYDRNTHLVAITADGERVVGGEKVAELVIDVVHHFRPILSRARAKDDGGGQAGAPTRQRRGSAAGPAAAGTGKHELIDKRYEKLRTVGSGGIGTVFLARQVLLDREVAIKEIRELFGFFTEPQRQEIIRRFDEEVRASAKLSHPNIASILDGNTSQDYPYVVTEFVSGGSLRRIISLAEAIPPELCVKIFLQMLHGLAHAHGKGVVHRGLKPENILFDSSGNVQITDFGMARVVERDQAVIQHVYVGMGSVAYMAPELFTNPSNVGPQTDLYALGILLYEMLARRLPGRRAPMPTKLHPRLPKVIDDIFDRLTQDERDDRYTAVDEVLEDFYQADASKEFLEPRGAVLFLANPLEKLKFKQEAPAAPEKDPPAAENPAAAAPAAAAPAAPAAPAAAAPAAPAAPAKAKAKAKPLEPKPLDPKPLDPKPIDPKPGDPAEETTSPAAKTDSAGDEPSLGFERAEGSKPGADATKEADTQAVIESQIASSEPAGPLTPEPLTPDPPLAATPSGEQGSEEADGDDGESRDDGEKPKRRRVQRPYSFQQRIKDRDK